MISLLREDEINCVFIIEKAPDIRWGLFWRFKGIEFFNSP